MRSRALRDGGRALRAGPPPRQPPGIADPDFLFERQMEEQIETADAPEPPPPARRRVAEAAPGSDSARAELLALARAVLARRRAADKTSPLCPLLRMIAAWEQAGRRWPAD